MYDVWEYRLYPGNKLKPVLIARANSMETAERYARKCECGYEYLRHNVFCHGISHRSERFTEKLVTFITTTDWKKAELNFMLNDEDLFLTAFYDGEIVDVPDNIERRKTPFELLLSK